MRLNIYYFSSVYRHIQTVTIFPDIDTSIINFMYRFKGYLMFSLEDGSIQAQMISVHGSNRHVINGY